MPGRDGCICDECAELTRCLQCEHCFDCAGLDQCDDCYLCEECCLENSEDAGCTHGYCVESADYLDHLGQLAGFVVHREQKGEPVARGGLFHRF